MVVHVRTAGPRRDRSRKICVVVVYIISVDERERKLVFAKAGLVGVSRSVLLP